MDKNELEKYIESGCTIAEISEKTNKSKTSVRHWLTKYGLKTTGKAGAKPKNDIVDGMKMCSCCKKILPISEFRERKDRPGTLQPYCKSCASGFVVEKNNRHKKALVKYMGGKCADCGIVGHHSIYDFHHTEPEHKDFTIQSNRHYNFAQLIDELDKCVMLCANCHTKRHLDMKIEEGYNNKIEGNTERFKAVRHEKLKHACNSDIKCSKCGYDECEEALVISFQDEDKKFYKYNKNPENWSEEFKEALDNSTVLCKNCHRVK